eukprot:scaffold24442_cov279-Cylindrotheca_fusiformis.AAC.1
MDVAWANPGSFTINNYPCYENGQNCVQTAHYQDPSQQMEALQLRVVNDKKAAEAARGNIRG